MIGGLRQLWGKVRRTPALPESSGTATVTVQEPRAWAEYSALMDRHASYAGWTFCKFGIRGPRVQDHAEVMGIVRAPFGAWWATFACIDPDTGFRTIRGLACVEHTRTGLAIGVFGDMDIAVQAAEIAIRLDDWSGFNLDNPSMQLVRRLRTAWDAAGITPSTFTGYPTVHGTVPEDAPAVAIFVKSAVTDQRPEMLS